MDYWCKNVELPFFKLVCKMKNFQSSTGLHQGKMLFSLILFRILYKAAVPSDIRILKNYFQLLYSSRRLLSFLVFILFMYVICFGKKLNLITRFSSAISLLNWSQVLFCANFAVEEYSDSAYFFSGRVGEHLTTKLLFYLCFVSFSHLIRVTVNRICS